MPPRVRDPRVQPASTPTVDRLKPIIRGRPVGDLHQMTFDEVRVRINEPNVTDGELDQALREEGLEVE